MENKSGLASIQRFLACQFGMTLLTAVITMLFWNFITAKSVLLGGLVSILPTACFATLFFHYRGASAARQIVNRFYKGEAIKMALTMALFALVFKFCNIIPLAFLSGYIMAQMVFWLAPLLFN